MLKKIFVSCIIITILIQTVAFAAPEYYTGSYIIGGYRYLSSDVAAYPSELLVLNNAVVTYGESNLILDLGPCGICNYFDFITQIKNHLGLHISNDSFQTYATDHPAIIQPGTLIYNPNDVN
jgi:hypothetical protein